MNSFMGTRKWNKSRLSERPFIRESEHYNKSKVLRICGGRGCPFNHIPKASRVFCMTAPDMRDTEDGIRFGDQLEKSEERIPSRCTIRRRRHGRRNSKKSKPINASPHLSVTHVLFAASVLSFGFLMTSFVCSLSQKYKTKVQISPSLLPKSRS